MAQQTSEFLLEGGRSPQETFRRPPAERLKVSEIFYSIQGESTFAGLPCVLIRLVGCQMRCSWCDTQYSFFGGSWMTRKEILDRVRSLGCALVELTGGEPLLQPGALPLLQDLCDAGYQVLLETGGGVDISRVDDRVRRIVDIKCPGSGEAENNHWPNLEALKPGDELKLVLAGRDDYHWARDLVLEHDLHQKCPVHFSPVHGQVDLRELAGWILRDRLPVRLQIQVHKLIWGADTPGV